RTGPASEERPDRLYDGVLVVDDWDERPLVEGRARMRDAAADQVADLDLGVGGDEKVGVLVVELTDLETRVGVLPLSVAREEARNRTTRVIRDVALAEPHDREHGLRSRQHNAPRLERGLQPIRRALRAERRGEVVCA